jgi:gamma-glutamyl:cysteine ligase YbdK (ATP-grasp superfamily)
LLADFRAVWVSRLDAVIETKLFRPRREFALALAKSYNISYMHDITSVYGEARMETSRARRRKKRPKPGGSRIRATNVVIARTFAIARAERVAAIINTHLHLTCAIYRIPRTPPSTLAFAAATPCRSDHKTRSHSSRARVTRARPTILRR